MQRSHPGNLATNDSEFSFVSRQRGSLLSALESVTSTSQSFVFLSVANSSGRWDSTDTGDIVLEWAPPVLRIMSAADSPSLDFDAFVFILRQPGVFSAGFPLDPSTITPSSLGRVERLILSPPIYHSSYPAALKSVVGTLLDYLPHFRSLRKLTLPFDNSINFTQVLRFASALPHFDDLTLNGPNLRIFPLSRSVASINEGLNGFDHLGRLCITRDALFTSVHQCLGSLQGLNEIKIVATSSGAHNLLSEPNVYDFPVLRTMEIEGSFSDLKWALLAFTNPTAQRLRKLKLRVEAGFIFNKTDMIDALSTLALRCSFVRHLSIRIRGSESNNQEALDWQVFAPLIRLHSMKAFDVRHPTPLFLLDHHIQQLLRSWPHARSISLNPSPPGYIQPWRLSTLESLVHVVKYGHSLRHFALHLRNVGHSAVRSAIHHGISNDRLRELDLGTSSMDARPTHAIQKLFPQAYIV